LTHWLPPFGFIDVLDESALIDQQMTSVEVQNRRIVLIPVGGKINALDDTCPHLGGSLGKGTLQEGKVVCPRHHWSFEIATGKPEAGTPCKGVAVHQVRLENGRICVKLNP
jgi:nitrite reductase/ring-hydroxylating ferredoxin subunit